MKLMCSIILVFWASTGFTQFTVSGFIEDTQSKERLPGVNIYEAKSQRGTTSNAFGFYSMTLTSSDTVVLRFSFIGYKSKIVKVNLPINTTLNIQLNAGIELDEITIVGDKTPV